eukprot:COSAG06_NODE_14030_length_1196_cov_1.585232_2_plen_90_part_00
MCLHTKVFRGKHTCGGLGGTHACCLTVTGLVVGLAGNALHKLRAQVVVLVLELDRLRDGHAILRDLRRAVRLLDGDVPALRQAMGSIRV